MKVAVIGAGVAGLAALRHSLKQNHECVAFEQTGDVGGTWQYVDQTGTDENGLLIHSSMYEGLRTNLPKELMAFENFPHVERGKSFISQPEILKYLQDFAKELDLKQHIKFYHHAMQVYPLENGGWKVRVKNMKTKSISEDIYDVIFVCVGNFSAPKIPKLPGLENFEGRYTHSHVYRKPDKFKDKRVLLVGGGASGVDISRTLLAVTNKVFLSVNGDPTFKVSPDIILKPEVEVLKKNTAVFLDESEEFIDHIIFCTGYKYTYPFLTPACGIKVENNWVKYLYKHILNIQHPTMAFIGVPYKICFFPVSEVQVKFALSYFSGGFSKTVEEMIDDTKKDVQRRRSKGFSDHYMHMIGPEQQDAYLDDITTVAKIDNLPRYIGKLYAYHRKKENYTVLYEIINDDEFVEHFL